MTTEKEAWNRMRSQLMDREGHIRTGGEKDMLLPEGKTCEDCVFFTRCSSIYGHIAKDEVCDWSPSQFVEKKERSG